MFQSMKYLIQFTIILFFCSVSPAFSIEIGIVDFNDALNQSEAGIRSKNILERRGRQKHLR